LRDVLRRARDHQPCVLKIKALRYGAGIFELA
jgi:hypothetical protein